jgi:acyl-CoA thioesterase-1
MHHRIVVVTLAILLGFAIPVNSQSLLVLGDSLSAGYGMTLKESWVSLLKEQLSKPQSSSTPRPITVVNASVSGETTAGALARLPALLKQHKPKWVIIELGGNDGLRGYPLKALKANLIQLIKTSQDAGAEVLLLGMKLLSNYGPAYTEAFHRIFFEVAEELDIPWVPFFVEPVVFKEDLMQTDGIHPNAKAQPILLNRLWPCLKRWWQSPKAAQSECTQG